MNKGTNKKKSLQTEEEALVWGLFTLWAVPSKSVYYSINQSIYHPSIYPSFHPSIHLSIPVYMCVCVHVQMLVQCAQPCVLFVFGRNASQHGGTNRPDPQHLTHLVFCPLLPLGGIRYHSLLLQHCQTQFQSFSSAKSSCIFRLRFVIKLRSGNGARGKSVGLAIRNEPV